MPVLAFTHAPSEGLGTIAAALKRQQIPFREVDLTTPHQPPITSHCGLILMGGPMSANDDLPWIPHELAAIRELSIAASRCWVFVWARS